MFAEIGLLYLIRCRASQLSVALRNKVVHPSIGTVVQISVGGNKLTSIGGFAKAFLTAQAAVFVGSLRSVGGLPATQFSQAFYTQFKAGKTLSEAATLARNAARSASEATRLAYAVYGHLLARMTYVGS